MWNTQYQFASLFLLSSIGFCVWWKIASLEICIQPRKCTPWVARVYGIIVVDGIVVSAEATTRQAIHAIVSLVVGCVDLSSNVNLVDVFSSSSFYFQARLP